MPQPLSRVKPDIRTVTWSARVFSAMPKFAVSIATAIAISANIDHELGLLLSRVLKTDSNPALAIFSKLQTMQLQKVAIEAAASATLDAQDFRVFKAALLATETAQIARNKLAHWLWGYSEDLDDAILLIDPDYFSQRAMSVDNWRRGYHDDIASLSFNLERIFVYKESDFEQIIRDLAEADRILKFLAIYIEPSFDDNSNVQSNPDSLPLTRAESLRQLSNQRLFREALDRFDAKAKNTQ